MDPAKVGEGRGLGKGKEGREGGRMG